MALASVEREKGQKNKVGGREERQTCEKLILFFSGSLNLDEYRPQCVTCEPQSHCPPHRGAPAPPDLQTWRPRLSVPSTHRVQSSQLQFSILEIN